MSASKKPLNGTIPGSSVNGEPGVYLAVGILRRSHGIHGDLLVEVLTDFPERLKPGSFVFVGENKERIKITRRRPHVDGVILGFEGVANSEQAARYRTNMIYVSAEDRPPLPEGEYYHHQILGLQVKDESGTVLGHISDIIVTGSNDVYVITTSDLPPQEILIPALKQVILNVDLEAKTMSVHLLPGLLDNDSSAE